MSQHRLACLLLALVCACAFAKHACLTAVRNTDIATDPASCCYVFESDTTVQRVIGQWNILLTLDTRDVRIPHRVQPLADVGLDLAPASSCAVSRIYVYAEETLGRGVWMLLDTRSWMPLRLDDDAYMHVIIPRDLSMLTLIDTALLRVDMQCGAQASCMLAMLTFSWASGPREVRAERVPDSEVFANYLSRQPHDCIHAMRAENECVPLTDLSQTVSAETEDHERPESVGTQAPRVARADATQHDIVTAYSATLTLIDEHATTTRQIHTRFTFCPGCITTKIATRAAEIHNEQAYGRVDFCATTGVDMDIREVFTLPGNHRHMFHHAVWDSGMCVLNTTTTGSSLGFSQCEFYFPDKFVLKHTTITPVAVYHDASGDGSVDSMFFQTCTSRARRSETRAVTDSPRAHVRRV